ncbi:MAG: glycosyltransferase [Nanoarchaeota archaeon]
MKKSYTEKILQRKKLMFAFLNNSTEKDASYQNYYLPLKKLFGKTVLFDPLREMNQTGKKKMEEKFISIVEKEKPDFIFIDSRGNEITLDFLEKIKRISKKTKILSYTGDDDKDFGTLKRYHALFMDCTFTAQPHYLNKYKKDGVKNVLSIIGVNTEAFKPIKTKKIYDVVFIGKASRERVKTIKFLVEKGVKVIVFGSLWNNYPEFKDICKGHINSNEMPNVINQTKISIGLSKNKHGVAAFKWRTFEIASCRAFSLVDYFEEYKKYFKINEEIVMFKDEEDLVEKINYYLKHEKEREKIAKNAYKRIIKDYDVYSEFKEIFKKIIENPDKFSQRFPKVKGKTAILTGEQMSKKNEEIKGIINKFDYISFSDDKSSSLEYKNYLQVLSLEKTGKQMSICDYYVYDKWLGDYLTTDTFRAYEILEKNKFNQAITINQMVIKKDFFMNNINKFKSIFEGKNIDIINEKNACFVSIPLVRLNSIRDVDSKTFSEFYHQKNFLSEMFILLKRKNLSFVFYLYRLLSVAVKSPPLRSFLINTAKIALAKKSKF